MEELFRRPPTEALKAMMELNITDAKRIYELSREQDCLDSQDFLDWQDELNAISIKYK